MPVNGTDHRTETGAEAQIRALRGNPLIAADPGAGPIAVGWNRLVRVPCCAR